MADAAILPPYVIWGILSVLVALIIVIALEIIGGGEL